MAPGTADTAREVAALGDGFVSGTASLEGMTLHYVRGGSGPLLVLVHGFPQDWFEWRKVLPRLAQRFTVVAVDLRGVGGSAAPRDGYDAATMAQDVRQLVDHLDLGPAHVVGHDVGGWVAYALARLAPGSVRTVVVMETLLPGVEPFSDPGVDVPLWHGEFHMVPGLPEALVADRQATYFRYFFETGTVDHGVIGDDDVEHYARAYGDADHLRAAFEMYRAIPANVEFAAAHTGPVDLPLLLVGGEHVFGPVMAAIAENLRRDHGWADVRVAVVAGGRHYLTEERPDDVASLIEEHTRRG